MRTLKTAVLAVFALGVLLRLPTFGRALLSDDEAIYATTADAMRRKSLDWASGANHARSVWGNATAHERISKAQELIRNAAHLKGAG